MAEAVEKFALNYSKRHLNETRPSERIFSPQWVRLQPLNLFSFKVYSSVSYWLPDSPMGCYKPNLYEMLSLNVIDSSILSICLILWFFAVKKEIKCILEQQERIRILQIVKPFFSPCLLKLFLNNRLMSNTLLTEIDESCKYFPLTSYYTLSSKLAYHLRYI